MTACASSILGTSACALQCQEDPRKKLPALHYNEANAQGLLSKLKSNPVEISRALSNPRWDRKVGRINDTIFSNISQQEKDDFVHRVVTSSLVGDRAVGTFVGLAVGDWVGAPLEFLPCTQVAQPSHHCWDPDTFSYVGPAGNAERDELELGQWTDDTSMALCLADSLLLRRQYDGSDARRRYWNWHAEGLNNAFRKDVDRAAFGLRRTSFGLGYNICRGLAELAPGKDVPPFFIDRESQDSGNGSLMRLAPVPLFCLRRSDEELRTMAMDSSRATHTGDLAAECAAFWAFMCKRAVLRSSARSDDACEVIDAGIKEYLKLYSEVTSPELKALLASNSDPNGKEACWRWRDSTLLLDATAKARGSGYNGYPFSAGYFGSYCMDALAVALHVNYYGDSFEAVIVNAANILGDADTLAAIAGQLAGAIFGYSGIKSRYVSWLRRWDDGEIATRAALLMYA